jgi:hypothetical protein
MSQRLKDRPNGDKENVFALDLSQLSFAGAASSTTFTSTETALSVDVADERLNLRDLQSSRRLQLTDVWSFRCVTCGHVWTLPKNASKAA